MFTTTDRLAVLPDVAPRRSPLLLLAVGMVALNLVNNLVLHDRAYVAVNLAATVVLLVVARRSGMSWDALGLSRSRLWRGARIGAIAAAVVAAVLLTVAAVPPLQAQVAAAPGPSGSDLAWTVLLRIPFGTALPEELLFRSVLLGVLLTRTTPSRAVWWSAGLFGLWHVLPTLDPASAVSGGLGAVLGAVAVTAVAGLGFAWLRLHADSVLAPVAAHAAINGIAVLVAAGVG